MHALPISSKQLFFPLFVCVLAFTLWIFDPITSQWLAYDKQAIQNNQWWRLLTGHFLHTNTQHLILNLSGLILLWALHGQYYSPRWITLFLLLCSGTSVGIYFASELTWYVGLSGALHGLFILGAYFDIVYKLKSGWLLMIGIWSKVIYEQLFGASHQISILIEANVAIDAHLYGTVTGTIVALACLSKKLMKHQTQKN